MERVTPIRNGNRKSDGGEKNTEITNSVVLFSISSYIAPAPLISLSVSEYIRIYMIVWAVIRGLITHGGKKEKKTEAG